MHNNTCRVQTIESDCNSFLAFQRLECPFDTKTGIAHKAFVSGEIVRELDLTSDIEVGNADGGSVQPQLRFGEQGEVSFFKGKLIHVELGIIAPEIKEAFERKTLKAKQVVDTPYGRKFEGQVSASRTDVVVIHQSYRSRFAEIVVMEGVFCTKAGYPAAPGGTVILHMDVEVLQLGVLPEVETAFNLEVAAVNGAAKMAFSIAPSGIVVIDEKERVAPIVTLKHLKGARCVTATEVI